MIDSNAPAYPVAPTEFRCGHFGMSKRELFAAMAMQGLLSDSKLDGAPALFGQQAVTLADALIAALNEERTP